MEQTGVDSINSRLPQSYFASPYKYLSFTLNMARKEDVLLEPFPHKCTFIFLISSLFS